MTAVVTSDAAVAKVTVPVSTLKSDPLFNLILSVAPSYQINVDATKKGSTVSLTSKSDKVELTQRNSILRGICGMTFHNALDKLPFYLLGGHSASGQSSSESALCLASISSYMSIASSIRSKAADISQTHQHLNQVLEDNSYLVGSTPKATLADLDVFFALSEVSGGKISIGKDLNHLKRWILAVSSTVEDMIAYSGERSLLPDVQSPTLDFENKESSPIYYFGDEENIDIIISTTDALPNAASSKGNKATSSQGGEVAKNSGGQELSEEQKKAAAEKRAKKNAEKAKKKKKAAPVKKEEPQSTEIDASAFDIRVGKIVEVWEHEESEKLWCEKVDLGEGEPRQILSGLRKFYKKEEMQDRVVLVLCNLKKMKLGGVPSHGMVLCASNAEHTEVEFVIPPEGAAVGEKVTFEGFDGDAVPENKFAKKKMLEKLAPDLKTDENGVVVWKGAKSKTSAGPCVASKGMSNAQVS
jgi:aminoacyl tRNA synthase complex-interacting multifunctional protein 1